MRSEEFGHERDRERRGEIERRERKMGKNNERVDARAAEKARIARIKK